MPHPLPSVVHELERTFSPCLLSLDSADGQTFVDALLDAQLNRLSTTFRRQLYHRTRGHALFTVEMLRALQTRGSLIQDAEQGWVEGPTVDWEVLPIRVEAVIARSLDRLPRSHQRILEVASVEGEEFTAEAVAQVLAVDVLQVVSLLSDDLGRQHQLVQASRLEQVDGRYLSHYRFCYPLFRTYLYRRLDLIERAYLHSAISRALEEVRGVELTC